MSTRQPYTNISQVTTGGIRDFSDAALFAYMIIRQSCPSEKCASSLYFSLVIIAVATSDPQTPTLVRAHHEFHLWANGLKRAQGKRSEYHGFAESSGHTTSTCVWCDIGFQCTAAMKPTRSSKTTASRHIRCRCRAHAHLTPSLDVQSFEDMRNSTADSSFSHWHRRLKCTGNRV